MSLQWLGKQRSDNILSSKIEQQRSEVPQGGEGDHLRDPALCRKHPGSSGQITLQVKPPGEESEEESDSLKAKETYSTKNADLGSRERKPKLPDFCT